MLIGFGFKGRERSLLRFRDFFGERRPINRLDCLARHFSQVLLLLHDEKTDG